MCAYYLQGASLPPSGWGNPHCLHHPRFSLKIRIWRALCARRASASAGCTWKVRLGHLGVIPRQGGHGVIPRRGGHGPELAPQSTRCCAGAGAVTSSRGAGRRRGALCQLKGQSGTLFQSHDLLHLPGRPTRFGTRRTGAPTQDVLDSYGAGVSVDQRQRQKVDPPTQVIDAFRDVQAARADKERYRKARQSVRASSQAGPNRVQSWESAIPTEGKPP